MLLLPLKGFTLEVDGREDERLLLPAVRELKALTAYLSRGVFKCSKILAFAALGVDFLRDGDVTILWSRLFA